MYYKYNYFFNTGTRQSGAPIHIMLNNNQATKIDPRLLPDDKSAVREFETNGGQLTVYGRFGEDPLEGSPSLFVQRETEFHRRFPDFSDFFHSVVNGDYYLFHEGLLCFIDISKRLSTL